MQELSEHFYHPQQNRKRNLGDILHRPYGYHLRVCPQIHQRVHQVFYRAH